MPSSWHRGAFWNKKASPVPQGMGEVPFENYLRIENADLPAATVAQQIKDTFDL